MPLNLIIVIVICEHQIIMTGYQTLEDQSTPQPGKKTLLYTYIIIKLNICRSRYVNFQTLSIDK